MAGEYEARAEDVPKGAARTVAHSLPVEDDGQRGRAKRGAAIEPFG